jgi:hypothetical protein
MLIADDKEKNLVRLKEVYRKVCGRKTFLCAQAKVLRHKD